jgi:hypothetical protein
MSLFSSLIGDIERPVCGGASEVRDDGRERTTRVCCGNPELMPIAAREIGETTQTNGSRSAASRTI